jgi:hypothetical protein
MRDRELILGVLAAKMRLVSPAQLEAASRALVDGQDRSLLTLLQDSGALTPNQRELLEAMADAALAASEGKPRSGPCLARRIDDRPAHAGSGRASGEYLSDPCGS